MLELQNLDHAHQLLQLEISGGIFFVIVVLYLCPDCSLGKPDPLTHGEGVESTLYMDLFRCNHECSINQIAE